MAFQQKQLCLCAKAIQWRKIVFKNGAGTIGCSYVKENNAKKNKGAESTIRHKHYILMKSNSKGIRNIN